MSEFEILPPADAILVQVAPALLQVLNHEDIAIGGGTVLAARWQHRQSTDICLTVPPPAFERESGRMAELLKAAAVTDVLHGRGWLTGICANGEFSISTTPPLLRSPAKPADHEGRFGILLEPTAEILGRKLRLRMYNNGEFVSRDFYDICTAHERDPSALDQALSSLTEDMGHEIAREIASLGQHASRMGRPLTGVLRPEWLDGLADRTGRLVMSRYATRPEKAGGDGSERSMSDDPP
ncbi:MAG: nucleotidyl transferase AbiEii/AbiGii toxin family protein [Boseongicola sp. SB0667_bin_21]|nr:nucleotidyl transferase AbiEii/AbiGii toxin family protein [Boseongicola sp. SB0667_bin_21]